MPDQFERRRDHWRASFTAMASPCEVLVEAADAATALRCATAVEAEARRIEARFSRYRDDSIVQRINRAGGKPVAVDEETADLLDFAHRCHELSRGRFDVTAGVLRRLWRFDGSDHVPSRKQVKTLLPLIGWSKVSWIRPVITLPPGMEIDLGGVGKEYAVDRAAKLPVASEVRAALVNFGGDLRAWGERGQGKAWEVGVERPGAEGEAALRLRLSAGSLATSGDARRYLLRRGVRYSHILNPRTGWPVMSAPRSVTVLGDTCMEAGLLATFAMLQGKDAESFLAAEGVRHWIVR